MANLRQVLSDRLESEHFDDGKLAAVKGVMAMGPWQPMSCADAAHVLQVRWGVQGARLAPIPPLYPPPLPAAVIPILQNQARGARVPRTCAWRHPYWAKRDPQRAFI